LAATRTPQILVGRVLRDFVRNEYLHLFSLNIDDGALKYRPAAL